MQHSNFIERSFSSRPQLPLCQAGHREAQGNDDLLPWEIGDWGHTLESHLGHR